LRLTIQQKDSRSATVKIEGKIAGENVAEFDRAWRELISVLGDKQLSVDLCGVTFMDGKARDLLAEIYATTQATLIADTPLTKYFAQQAQGNIDVRNSANSKFTSENKVRRQS